MSEKRMPDRVLNPIGLEHPVLTGAVLGLGAAVAAGTIITTWLHRGTHGGVEYSERAKKFLRGANWPLTGMAQTDWVDHRVHHAYTGRYDEEAHRDWNENRPDGAPEAPAAIFRGPYEPELEGRFGHLKVHLNTFGMHRKAIKDILPWLHAMHGFDQQNGIETRDHWPAHLRRVDMEEADPKAFRNRYKGLGIPALWTTVGLIAGPKVALTGAAVHVGAQLNMAGIINAETHTGQERGFKNRLLVMLGFKKPVPDADGETAANLLPGMEFLVMGELRHLDHHKDPANPYLSEHDTGTLIIRLMEEHGWATTPGAQEERDWNPAAT